MGLRDNRLVPPQAEQPRTTEGAGRGPVALRTTGRREGPAGSCRAQGSPSGRRHFPKGVSQSDVLRFAFAGFGAPRSRATWLGPTPLVEGTVEAERRELAVLVAYARVTCPQERYHILC